MQFLVSPADRMKCQETLSTQPISQFLFSGQEYSLPRLSGLAHTLRCDLGLDGRCKKQYIGCLGPLEARMTHPDWVRALLVTSLHR